jgi:hypothetical protein
MGLWGEAFAVDKQSSAVEAMDRREGMVKGMKIYSYLAWFHVGSAYLSYTFWTE